MNSESASNSSPALPQVEVVGDLSKDIRNETKTVPTHPEVVMSARAVYPLGWTRYDLKRGVVLGCALLIILYFLYLVQAILPPFIIAFFLAALLDPSLRQNEKHGKLLKTRTQGILVFYFMGLAFLVVLVTVVAPLAFSQVQEISNNMGTYYSNIVHSANSEMALHSHILKMLGMKETNVNAIISDRSGPVQNAITLFFTSVHGAVQWLVGHFFWLIIIPVAGFFFMRDYPAIRAHMIALFPDQQQEHADRISREVVDVFSAYLRGLAKICALMALCAFILFTLLDVQYAIFLGLLAGLFYAVPYVGNLITATSAATMAYLNPHHFLFIVHIHQHSFVYALVVAVCYVLMANLVFDQLIYPRIVGGSVGLHPVVAIFALVAGATLFGVWGMLLATPAAASIQVILVYMFPRLTEVGEDKLDEPLPDLL